MKVAGILIAAVALLVTASLGAKAESSELFERYGMRLELVPYPGNNPYGMQVALVTEVSPSSLAEEAGFAENMVLQDSDDFDFPKQRGDATAASAEQDLLNLLERQGYVYGYTVSLEMLNDLRATPTYSPFILPRVHVERSLGFRLSENQTVLQVYDGSPAASAGIELGDVVRPAGVVSELPTEIQLGIMMDTAVSAARRGYEGYELSATRNGQHYIIDMSVQ